MSETSVTLYHGTTLESARDIATQGACKRLYVTMDAQLATSYARFRGAEEAADGAVVSFDVPDSVFKYWLAAGSARAKSGLEPFGCYVLYKPTWQQLSGFHTNVWTTSELDRERIRAAA